MFIRRLTVGAKLTCLMAIYAVSLVGFGIWSYWNMSRVSMSGPLAAKVLEANTLTADILPPPAYIVETHLVTYQIESAARQGKTAAELQPLVDRAKQLSKDFEDRISHWSTTLEADSAKEDLCEQAAGAAREYFRIRDEQFIPACLAGRAADASTILESALIAKYNDHRAHIDRVVEATARKVESTTLEAARMQASSGFQAIALVIAVLAVTAVFGWFVARDVIRSLRMSAQSMHSVANEDLTKIGQRMRDNASETTQQATLASGAAEEVSANAHALATAVSQFEISIKEISGNATRAANVARAAVSATQETTQTVSQLGASSMEIGNVIKVINSIAEQTNLLALNATIEAARAGDAGKGFAVVANEVKELAKQTSSATEDIVRRINAIQNDTTQAITAIGHVSEIISEISESQNAIATAVEEQSAMTAEIARNISEVATGSSEIARNIVGVAEAAKSTSTATDETLQAAGEIDSLASDLLQLVGAMRDEVQDHLKTPATSRKARATSVQAAAF